MMHSEMDDYIDIEGFSKFSEVICFFAFWVSVLTVGYGMYIALFESQPDTQYGETIRILYIHVSAAWLSLIGYVLMAGSSLVFLMTRSIAADLVARNAAPIGAAFTIITLATGALWAKPAWGVWWAWDARLTSVLILLFLYMGYMAITHVPVIDDANRRIAAMISVFGAINLPIIKFSVDWWNSIHPPAQILSGGLSATNPDRLEPIIIMTLGFAGLFLTSLLLRMQATLYQQKWRQMQLQSMAN